MPAVFAQMEGDRAGAGALGGQRRLDRIGIADAPRLAQRGDVIDIDAEPRHPQAFARPACRPIAAPISRASAPISAGSSPSIITRASISVPEYRTTSRPLPPTRFSPPATIRSTSG